MQGIQVGDPPAPASIVILFSFYLAAAVSGAVAGRGVRGALTSADTDVMCRANSSGTAAVGISASGSSLIGAPDGVTLIAGIR